jgi:hypothetical protein
LKFKGFGVLGQRARVWVGFYFSSRRAKGLAVVSDYRVVVIDRQQIATKNLRGLNGERPDQSSSTARTL